MGPALAALGSDNNKTRKMMALRTIVFPQTSSSKSTRAKRDQQERQH
jgi:hypothetical protein